MAREPRCGGGGDQANQLKPGQSSYEGFLELNVIEALQPSLHLATLLFISFIKMLLYYLVVNLNMFPIHFEIIIIKTEALDKDFLSSF